MLENYLRDFFENLNYTPKEFAIKHYKKSQNSELQNTVIISLTFDTDFLSDIEPNQFHTNDSFTGEIVNIGGIINYNNRQFIPRYFIKGDGKSWLDGGDLHLFHRPFGNLTECYSANYNSIRPNQYLIEYFPMAEVVSKIRKIYMNDLDKNLSVRILESFQVESNTFRCSIEFIEKEK